MRLHALRGRQGVSLPEGQRRESGSTPKHNLPAQRTAFVGREPEILEVKRQLAMTRLLTLTGAGGSGRTRLALEVPRTWLAPTLAGCGWSSLRLSLRRRWCYRRWPRP
jgi:hypothetical protein